MPNSLLFILFISSFLSTAQSTDFIDFDFSRADSIALINSNLKLTNPEKLAETLVKGLDSEPEKFRAIFRWITNNISYDTRMLSLQQTKELKLRYDKEKLLRWRQRFAVKVYRRTRTKKKSICEGYSRLLGAMCRQVGISCETIQGYSRQASSTIGKRKLNHAWNAVKINNKWYLTDATWASGYVSGRYFLRKFNKIYFLADPSYFIADHYPADKAWTLLWDKPSLSDFTNAPIKLEGFYKKNIVHFSPEEGVIKIAKDSTVSFSFTSNELKISRVSTETINKFRSSLNRLYHLVKSDEGYYVFQHKFTEKGNYRFYIYIDSDETFAYDVYIK